jgi:hypothetical protein
MKDLKAVINIMAAFPNMFRYIFPKTSVNLKPTTGYTLVAFTPTRSRTAAPGDIPSFFLRNTLNRFAEIPLPGSVYLRVVSKLS